MFWIYILLANLLIQIPNVLAIKLFGSSMGVKEAFRLAFFTIPVGFFASSFFTLYFAKASSFLSYPVMNLINIGVNIVVGFCVGLFVLKNSESHLLDYIGMFFIFTGVVMIIYKNQILSFLSAF